MSTIGTPNFTNFLFIFPHTENSRPKWPRGCFPEPKGYLGILSGVKASRRFPHTKQAGMALIPNLPTAGRLGALQSGMERLPHRNPGALVREQNRISAGAARTLQRPEKHRPKRIIGVHQRTWIDATFFE